METAKFKPFIATVLLFIFSGCNNTTTNNAPETEILDISQIWYDQVPDSYREKMDQNGGCMPGHSYLLVPSSIEANQTLRLQLYGCWSNQGEDYLGCPYGQFKRMVIDTKDAHKVKLHFEKTPTRKGDNVGCPAVYDAYFSLWHTYDINGSWAPGVLQVVVQNSDNKTLEANVTVEPVE